MGRRCTDFNRTQFGVVSEYHGTQRLSEGYYDGKDAYGTQHLRPACAITNNDVYWQDQCGNEMTLSTVDDAFATGNFPGLGGCNNTHCRLRFHFLRSFGVEANHQSNIDVAFRILTVDGPHLATDANPEGWLNHDMDMGIINRAVQLSITNTAMTETPSAPFFHIDSLLEDIGMHQTNIHSNYGVNYSITGACKRPLLYFLTKILISFITNNTKSTKTAPRTTTITMQDGVRFSIKRAFIIHGRLL